MSSKAFIVALVLVLPALMAPLALAETAQYKPRAEEPGDVCYSTGLGAFYDEDLFIPIKLAGQDIWTGLVFPNVTVSQFDLINSANLTLYFTLDFSTDGPETVTIYGYEDYLEAGTFESSAQLVYGPLTSAHVNINVSAIISGGFYTFNVTGIVAEITDHYWWAPGSSLCFIVYGAGEDLTRYVSANEWSPSQYPYLDVEYGADPGTGGNEESYIDSYRGLDIYWSAGGFPVLNTFDPLAPYTQVNMVWRHIQTTGEPIYELVSNGAGPTLHGNQDSLVESKAVIEGVIWSLEMAQTDQDLEIWRSLDMGASWVQVVEIDTSGVKQAGGLYYNNVTNCLDIWWAEAEVINYYQYNLTSSSGTNYGQVLAGVATFYGADLITDSSNNVYVARSGGWSGLGSGPYLYVRQRIGGVWSSTYQLAPNTDNYASPRWAIDRVNGAVILVCLKTSSGHWVNYHGLGAAISSWGSWYRVTYTQCTAAYNVAYNENAGRLWVGSERPDPDSPADIIPVACSLDYPFSGSATRYGSSNYTGHDFSGTSPVMDREGNTLFITMRQTGGGAVYLVEPSWFGGPHTVTVWAFEDIADASETPNLYRGLGVTQLYISAPGYVVRYPNGTVAPWDCVAEATTLEEVMECINNNLDPHPEDPNPPGWEEEEIFTRYQVILYLTIAGLAGIIAPPMFMAYKKDLSLIAPVLFLMAVGASLLLYLQYI